MIRTKKSNKRKQALAMANSNRQLHGARNSQQSANALLQQQPPLIQTNNFLATRKMNWFTVGASIFASNLGSEHFIGLSGSAAANGISVAAFEMNALIILQLATWIFLPVLIAAKISTLPEYMSKRFGGKRIRTYLAILSILLYIFTKISVNLYSGGIFIQQAVGWNLYTSAMFILALTCVMTLTGGLKGAMMIDNLQAIVMTIGASIVSSKALYEIGGWSELKSRYSLAVPSKVPANLTHCAKPNPRAFQMLRPTDDRDMPWVGFLIGQTPASIWYWAADQMMVQRFLSARSLGHVQGSAVFAGYLKILPLFFMIIPGMISRCLYTDEVACIDPDECQRYCQSSVSCSNTAYPRLVLELMPMGARGMMVAAMVAALMQDLCNVFNSASALFTCDIWPLLRPKPSQKEQETAGRVFVITLVCASIMWIPVIQEMQGGQLFIYIQAVAAMFWPPICAVYICAVMWKRTNEVAAFWSLMIGFCLGVMRMAMSFMYKEPSCGQHVDDRPWILKHVHYMYYAAFLFWTTILCVIIISRLTKPSAPFRLIRTTFWTRFDTNIRKDDKNVFEMKYSGATSSPTPTSRSKSSSLKKEKRQANNNNNSQRRLSGNNVDSEKASPRLSEDLSIAGSEAPLTGGQRLFTIEEQQEGKKLADLSSVIVDISIAAAKAEQQEREERKEREEEEQARRVPRTAPIISSTSQSSPFARRFAAASPPTLLLQHQSSLTASATAAVGEARKFLGNKLSQLPEAANLRGAKDMVLAAASHLGGNVAASVGSVGIGSGIGGGGGSGQLDSRVKFKNLRSDDNGDEDDSASNTDEDEDDDDDGATTNAAESTTVEDEDDDGGSSSDFAKSGNGKIMPIMPKSRTHRSQSLLSSALSSYKQKKRGGYQKALNEDEDEDDEEEDEDDDGDDERMNLNRSVSFRAPKKSNGSEAIATKSANSSAAAASSKISNSTNNNNNMVTSSDGSEWHRKSSKKKNASFSSGGGSGFKKKKKKTAKTKQLDSGGSSRKVLAKYEEDDDDLDAESGQRTFRCLDNSVALLIKTPLEDAILKCAVGAILLVAIGLFILLSLPPASPPKGVVDVLIKT